MEGKQELDLPPDPRTHQESYDQGLQAEEYFGADKKHPRHTHGINGWCVLGLVPLFDIIWDVCPDLMHILKNMFERLFIELPSGDRAPNTSKKFNPPKQKKNETAAQLQTRQLKFESEVSRHKEASKRAENCKYSERSQRQFDLRMRKLAGAKGTGIPYTMVPFKTLPGRRKQKCAAWVKFLRFYVPYALYGVGKLAMRQALLKLTDALRVLLGGNCDYDPTDAEGMADAKRRCADLKKKLVLALIELEKIAPESEFTIYLHEVVHAADFLFRWNNVRNYWCFITERFVGYIKGFVKNRHLALENMVRFDHMHLYACMSYTHALHESQV